MTELLEREDLLARLELARSEGGRLVFVGGEAGVGKTALVRAFASRAESRVLVGSCENLTTPTPLGPFLDLGLEPGEPRLVAGALLEELRGPALLVLEDVHWADQATLDALRVLGRRVESTPSLLLATYRDDEVEADHPLRVVLGELASAPSVSRLTVPRLSPEAVRELAAPQDADADAIYRLTRGNAFYVTEILAAGTETLPETVRDAVLARAARLEVHARLLLDAASLVPARAELRLLEAIVPGLEGLQACLASGMLSADRDTVAFRHELARLAVESAVAPEVRLRLHAAILAALAVGDSPDPSRLAHHAEQAGDRAAVLEHAPVAARRAVEAGAHREAAAQYARALRHADGLPPEQRASLLSAYAHEAQVTGDYEPSIAARLAALALYRELGDVLAEGDGRWRLTMPYIALGRNEEAETASREAIELLERQPHGVELANAYGSQAYMRMLGRDNDDGVAWGEKAVALARRLGKRATESVYTGRWDEAGALAQQILGRGPGAICPDQHADRAGPPSRSPRRPRGGRRPGRGARARAPGRPPAAARARSLCARGGGVARGRSRPRQRGGGRRLSAGAREAASVVRGRVGLLAARGGSSRLDRRAVPAPAPPSARREPQREPGGPGAARTRRPARSWGPETRRPCGRRSRRSRRWVRGRRPRSARAPCVRSASGAPVRPRRRTPTD